MICPSCGAENPADKRFCGDCGTALSSACPTCGATNPPGKRFCGDCGTALGPLGGAVSTAGAVATVPGPSEGPAPAVHAGPEAERRLVTVLFADLVGFTPFAEERDVEDVRETLSRYFDLAREVIVRYGGTIEKFIGDAVMAVWGAPVAREDDAERAVRAALELADAIPGLGSGIAARCGVLTGEAAVTLGAVGEGMVAGDLVNTAARLQSVAPPGAVLVGEATQRAAAGAIAFEAAGETLLKGKAAPVPAWRALRVVAERGGRNRSEGLEAPFVGRSEELRFLKDLFHATSREGRLRTVSVIGPAGIGKSRLAWEFTKYLDGLVESVWWHDGRSPAYGDGITFWALGEMVRGRCGLAESDDEPTTRERVAATLEAHVPDPDERRWIEPALLALLGIGAKIGSDQLFGAWRLFFERLAATAPVVMVFEDVHFADPGLLDFIDSLQEWSRNAPIYILTLGRPELLERRPDWGAGKRSFHALQLEPLPEPAMRELIAGLVPGLPAPAIHAIVRRADGIPLYAVETVRMLVSEGGLVERDGVYVPTGDLSTLAVPETLTALIGARLDRLDPVDRSLVQDAAVLGQSFTLAGLAAVSGTDEAALEPRLRTLVRRELLDLRADPRSPERGQYSFVQALIREVAYNTLARRDRKTRHLAAARYFEQLGSDELAGALAGQYLAAYHNAPEGPEAEALGAQARIALSAAADRAAALGAHESAVSFLLQALEVGPSAEERAKLLERAARSASVAGRYTQAEELAGRAVELHRTLGDLDGAAEATALVASVMLDGRRIAEATAVLEAVRTTDGPALGDPAKALLLSTLSRAYMRTARYLDSIATADQALAIAEPLRLDQVIAETMVNKASSLGYIGRFREPVALLEAARELARRLGLTTLELRATNNLGATIVAEDPRTTIKLAEDALALAQRIGDRSMANFLEWGQWFGRFVTAREWDALERRFAELDRSDLEAADRAAFLGVYASVRSARGHAVDELLDELDRLVSASSDAQLAGASYSTQCFVAFIHGDLEEARRWSDRAMAMDPVVAGEYLPDAISLAVHRDDPDRLRALLEFESRRANRALARPATERRALEAGLAALEGRTREALGGYAAAQAAFDDLGLDMAAALLAVDMAAVLDPSEPAVVEAVARARAIFGRVDATALIARLDGVLAERAATSRGAVADQARDAAPTRSSAEA